MFLHKIRLSWRPYLWYIYVFSDIITAAAHSVSCTKENTEDGNFEKTSHSCSLYDVWLQKYNGTNTTVRHFAMEMDASNINGFKVPGM